MFDRDVAELDVVETLTAAADRHATRTEADLDLIELCLRFADVNPDPATIPGHVSLPGGERVWHSGGPGCPGFAEFAVAEFGAAIGRSAGSAAVFIGQALALRHRLPLTLAMIRSGHGEPWKARTIATACLALSVEAAGIVDRRVARIIDTVTPIQLDKIVKAAIQQADPEGARATAEQKAKERGVWAGKVDEHGTTTLTIRAATGDVIRLKATLRQLADALTDLGHTGPLNERMADTIGIISDPTLTQALLNLATHLANNPTSTPPPHPHPASTPDTHPAPPPNPTPNHDQDPNWESKPAWQQEPRPEREPQPHWEREPHCEQEPEPEADAGCGGGAVAPQGAPDDWFVADEPAPDEEPDWDPPHPSDPGYDPPPDLSNSPHPSDASAADPTEPSAAADQVGLGMDAAARRELARKLSAIRQSAERLRAGGTGVAGTGVRGFGRGRVQTTTVYVHLTDQTLLAGGGVTRVERFGPVFTSRLEELLGHGQIIIKPVIDLKDDRINVNAYEIPDRIRERVKLIHPVEQFPYGPAETTNSTDLDHIQPYDFSDTGPPGQTSITNLIPLRRYSHRVKTHGDWKVERLDDGALKWITKHGLKFRVDHKGTHRITDPPP